MRLRNVRGARDVLEQSPYVIKNPAELKGGWKKEFGRGGPLHIEIGMGKGRFLLEMAEKNPQLSYVGVELYASVLVRAAQKLEGRELPNLRLLNMPAEYLEDVFGPEEVDRIYLNFSDPWPKARHAKRRLTSEPFLARYEGFLSHTGQLEFKTDNRELFEFSMESVRERGWRLLLSTWDLHGDPALCAGNIMTEYEEKFSSEGKPICKLTACPPLHKI